jgi:orotate phosphoribosyltransferase
MEFRPSGYSDIQFDPVSLRHHAQRLSKVIPFLLKKYDAQAIAVTGKSGLSFAFATLMLIDFPLIVVRKDGESSHGEKIEGTRNVDVTRYLILDDFVASGDTVRNIVKDIEIHFKRHEEWCKGMADIKRPECVGVIEYSHHANYKSVNVTSALNFEDGMEHCVPIENAKYVERQIDQEAPIIEVGPIVDGRATVKILKERPYIIPADLKLTGVRPIKITDMLDFKLDNFGPRGVSENIS